jgi:predicted DsbA family dithiol-disulfide isomerase
MTTLLCYHDFNSAFCRVGVSAARAAASSAGVAMEPVPFELFPSPGPLPLPADALTHEVAQATALARQQGIQLVLPRLLGRTRKAHEAVVHARAEGLELAMLDALYDAVWRDGMDVGRLDILAEVAIRAGVDPGGLYVALGLDTHEPEVVRAERSAYDAGIHQVPAFRIGTATLAGAVPAADLVRWIDAQR